jgi:hypothetical protein
LTFRFILFYKLFIIYFKNCNPFYSANCIENIKLNCIYQLNQTLMYMRINKLLMPALSLLAISSMIFLGSCGDDEPDPVAPAITIDPATFTGAPGETVTATVSGELDGALTEMVITKYNGTTIDTEYGTDGSMIVTSNLPYTFTFTLGAEGLDGTPVRFGFVLTDANGLTGETNLIITTEATNTQLLTFFDWQYHSLLYQSDDTWVEGIADCEKDNILSFNTDGTMSYDYGALNGLDGDVNCGDGGCAGSCSGDASLVWATWSFNAAEDTLIAVRNLPTGEFADEVIWAITEFSPSYWRGTVDLGLWGLFDYGHAAVAKN